VLASASVTKTVPTLASLRASSLTMKLCEAVTTGSSSLISLTLIEVSS